MDGDRTDKTLLNKKVGKLLVTKILFVNSHRQTIWECLCDCGEKTKASTSHLNSGNKTSCGCLKGRTTHGMSKTRIWSIFVHMRQRCNDKNSTSYKNYGGRGIKCEWKSFEEFYADMKEGYRDDLTIERIDNNGNYCKENCRWATYREQSLNTRHNVILTHNGKSQTVSEWAEEIKMNYWTLIRRISRGWSHERALTTKEFNRGQK